MIDRRKKHKIQGSYGYPHIGNRLQTYFAEEKINKAALARELGVTSSVVSRYLTQQSLQLGILWKISLATKHNFMAEIIEQFPVNYETKKDREKETLLEEKDILLREKEDKIKMLEAELAVYRRIVGK